MKENDFAALRQVSDENTDPSPASIHRLAAHSRKRSPRRDQVDSVDEPGSAARRQTTRRLPTVLLVEDRPDEYQDTVSLLDRHGFGVLRATEEHTALDSFVRERPQVVVLHYGLLAGNEGSLIRQIRTVEPVVPIIVRGNGLTPATRRQLIVRFDVNSVHDDGDDPERFLELLDSAVAGTRCVERMRTEHEARSLILAKLCHALRTPLHIIQGYAELLQSQPAEASYESITGRVSQAVDDAIELMHDYVDLARLDAPGRGILRERVDIDQLLAEIRSATEQQIGDRHLLLRVGVTIPGASLQTDGARLRAILTQLLINAVKFTPAGEVELFVHPGGGSTAFIVADRGTDVPDAELSDMFTPFRQGGSESLASAPGQGIGLAIAERLSALIGASLSVRRRPSGGLLFLLSVPSELTAAVPTEADTLH